MTSLLGRSAVVLANTAPRLIFSLIQPESFFFGGLGRKTCLIMGLADRAAVQIEG